MGHTVREIADSIGARAEGDLDLVIDRAAEPADAGPADLAMASTPKYAEMLGRGQARAALLWPGADWQALGLAAAILPDRPRFAMSGLTRMLDPGQGYPPGIHPAAIIDDTAQLGAGVSVGPLAVIGAGVRIGAGSVIGPQCFIGTDAVLGPDCFLREQVSIGARVRIGARFIAQPGVRIGGDGFSFVTPEPSAVENARKTLGDQGDAPPQTWARIHSLGSVTLGDDVEIGMNSTIDSGTIRDTRIGNGTKLDSQIQIGHNVIVGNDTLICAQVGIAGSSVIGNNVVLGGQSGVSDNIFVGDRAILGAATKALSNVPAGRTMLGYPATQMESQMEIYKALRRLPRLLREVASLRKVVSKSSGDG